MQQVGVGGEKGEGQLVFFLLFVEKDEEVVRQVSLTCCLLLPISPGRAQTPLLLWKGSEGNSSQVNCVGLPHSRNLDTSEKAGKSIFNEGCSTLKAVLS